VLPEDQYEGGYEGAVRDEEEAARRDDPGQHLRYPA
jgi:hypothetical protein